MSLSVKSIIERFNKLSLIHKIAIGVVLSLLISIVVVSIIWIESPVYSILYYNLDTNDAAAVVNKLKEMRVPYRVKEPGKIYVPADEVYELRLKLASEGLPKGGSVGFEIFDKSNFGVSDFVQNINYIRALQGELSRTIASLEEIEWARVHIAMPRESLFVSRQRSPSASVVLKLKPNMALSDDQVQGIVYLVAAGVPKLESKDVVVIDTEGHVLAGGDKNNLFIGNQIKLKAQTERELEDKIQSLLERVVGPGKAIAKVSVDMDFSRVEKTQEIYDPDNVAIRSEQNVETQSLGGQAVPVGVPGVMSNLPHGNNLSGNPTAPTARTNQRQNNKIINYEISKTVQSIKEPTGKIVRISAAVLVDGTYKEANGKVQYIPRSKEEMSKLKLVVQKAIGYSKKRGDQIEIVNVPFNKTLIKEEAPNKIGIADILKDKNFWYRIVNPLTKGLVIIAIMLILAAILKKILKEVPLPTPTPLPEGLPKSVKELETDKAGEGVKALPLHEEIKEIAQQEPEKIAQIAKLWLKNVKEVS